jgi:hypothetical protein
VVGVRAAASLSGSFVAYRRAVVSGELNMTILVELDEGQSQRLRELALTLKVDAKELARAAINDLVSRPAEDFDRAVQYVLEKNRELYRRLA